MHLAQLYFFVRSQTSCPTSLDNPPSTSCIHRLARGRQSGQVTQALRKPSLRNFLMRKKPYFIGVFEGFTPSQTVVYASWGMLPLPMQDSLPAGWLAFTGRELSGRTMARCGLRMMPPFPSPPLSCRKAGFPRYGWKAGLSGETFPTHPSA